MYNTETNKYTGGNKEYRGSQLTFLAGGLVLNKLFSLLTLHDHYLERDECMGKKSSIVLLYGFIYI